MNNSDRSLARACRWACVALTLGVLFGCGDGTADEDAGVDAARADAGVDAGRTPDAGTDAGSTADAGPTGQCVPFVEALTAPAPDGGVGLGESIGAAIADCARNACVNCALARGMGAECGEGGTLRSCVLDCIVANDFGACPSSGCPAGRTCDVDVCRSDAATTVNAAIAAGELDLACTSCFAGISQCVAQNGCTFMCLSAGCACDTCQCEEGCPDAFAACSGLPPHLDCAEVATMCP